MNILGIIPARAGSKGIKDKNIYPLCGRPLIDWTYSAAASTQYTSISKIRISTDIESIISKYGNIICYKRPDELAKDESLMIDVIRNCFETYELYKKENVDAICLLQPTSPLRTAEDIDNAIDLFKKSGASSLYSGYYIGIKHKSKVYDKHTSEKHFQRNGAIFIAKRELIEQGKLWDDDVIEFEMPLSRSIDIDTMDDMYIAEALLEKRIRGGQK